jgi:hypothetical protein
VVYDQGSHMAVSRISTFVKVCTSASVSDLCYRVAGVLNGAANRQGDNKQNGETEV